MDEHLGLKHLIAYHEGRLPASEREAVQEHLSLCPRCTGRLRELREFEAAAARGDAGPEPLRQAAWDSLVRRLPERTPVVRPIADAARREIPRRRVLPWVTAAAAALLLALAGVWAVINVQQERREVARLEQRLQERDASIAALRQSLAEAERQLAAARERPERESSRLHELESRVAELTTELDGLRRTAVASGEIAVSVAPRFVLRGQETPASGFLRGGGAVNAVQIPAQAKSFKVSVNLGDRSIYDEYRLELLDRGGTVLWSARRPGKALLGDDGTAVSVSGLGPGRYRLRIEGLRPRGSDLLAEYLLAIVTANPR